MFDDNEPDDDDSVRVDPDSRARTHLANERTFLAWIRTAVTLIALGLASAQFLEAERAFGLPLSAWLAFVLIAGGVSLAIVARRRFLIGQELIERGRPLLDAGGITWISALLIALGGLAAIFILVVDT